MKSKRSHAKALKRVLAGHVFCAIFYLSLRVILASLAPVSLAKASSLADGWRDPSPLGRTQYLPFDLLMMGRCYLTHMMNVYKVGVTHAIKASLQKRQQSHFFHVQDLN